MANFTNVMIQTESNDLKRVLRETFEKYTGDKGVLFSLNGEDINNDERYMFDLYLFPDGELMYATKWEPNINDVKELARKTGASLTLSSEEFGVDNNYYIEFKDGDVIYSDTVHIFDYCRYDEENGGVIDNKTGDYWDSESEYLWDIFSSNKIKPLSVSVKDIVFEDDYFEDSCVFINSEGEEYSECVFLSDLGSKANFLLATRNWADVQELHIPHYIQSVIAEQSSLDAMDIFWRLLEIYSGDEMYLSDIGTFYTFIEHNNLKFNTVSDVNENLAICNDKYVGWYMSYQHYLDDYDKDILNLVPECDCYFIDSYMFKK